MNRITLNFIKFALAILTSCVLLINISTINSINSVNSKFTDRHNEATWFVFQLVKEYSNLVMRSNIQPIDFGQLWLAYDLTWSRFDILINSKESANFIENKQYLAYFESEFNQLKSIEPAVKLTEQGSLPESYLAKEFGVGYQNIIDFTNTNFRLQSPIVEDNKLLLQTLMRRQQLASIVLVSLFASMLLIFWYDSRLRLRLKRKDPVTSALNRAALSYDLQAIKSVSVKNLVSIKILNIYEINRKYGLDYGDTVLLEGASRIQSVIMSDSRLYRVSGGQFLVITPHHNQQLAASFTQSLKECLQAPLTVGELELLMNITVVTEEGVPRSELQERITSLTMKR